MIESLRNVSAWVKYRYQIDEQALTRGREPDGVGTMLGGIFQYLYRILFFSGTSDLVGVTGVRSRRFCVRQPRHHIDEDAECCRDGGAGCGVPQVVWGGAGTRDCSGSGCPRPAPYSPQSDSGPKTLQSVVVARFVEIRHDSYDCAELFQEPAETNCTVAWNSRKPFVCDRSWCSTS